MKQEIIKKMKIKFAYIFNYWKKKKKIVEYAFEAYITKLLLLSKALKCLPVLFFFFFIH